MTVSATGPHAPTRPPVVSRCAMLHRWEVVFLRHGESECNLKEQFTGWEDSGMTPKGFEQARKAGKYLKDHGFQFDIVFTSVLSRAIESAVLICEDSENKDVPIEKAWQLNARHPGVLQGLTKEVAVSLYGKEKVNIWRGSYDVMPECVGLDDNRHPVNNPSPGKSGHIRASGMLGDPGRLLQEFDLPSGNLT